MPIDDLTALGMCVLHFLDAWSEGSRLLHVR